MKIDNLQPIVRIMVREVALGLRDEDIAVNHPEYSVAQISKIRAGATFKRAVAEMQAKVDQELIENAAGDPVLQYLNSSALVAAQTLVSLARDDDGETPHAVQAKCADSILAKTGRAGVSEQQSTPIFMLSAEKLTAVINPKEIVLSSVPDSVDYQNLADVPVAEYAEA